jgi:hypothetical protein
LAAPREGLFDLFDAEPTVVSRTPVPTAGLQCDIPTLVSGVKVYLPDFGQIE